MSDNQIQLGIGVPAYGGRVVTGHVHMWLTLGHTLAVSSARFALRYRGLVDVCGVDVARNELCEGAIAAGCDWLLMVDADTWVEDGTSLLQMISTADRQGADVAVGPVLQRGSDEPHLMAYVHELSDDGFVRRPLAPSLLDGRVVPCHAAATAVMAIRIATLVKLRRPWFRFDYIDGTHRFLGEDLAFCARIRERAGTIVVDGRVKTRHLQRPRTLVSPVGSEDP